MKKTLIALLSSVIFLFGAEPSAFKAGDLDNPNPYGLTSAEKKILEQNQNIQNINRNLFDTSQTQNELKSELEGIRSIVIGHSEKIKNFEYQLKGEDSSSLLNLNKRFEENLKLQNENYDRITQTLSQIAALLDDTRENYVSKKQLKAILGKQYKELEQTKKQAKKQNPEDENKSTQKEDIASVDTDKTETSKPKTIEDKFKTAQALFRDEKLKESKDVFAEIEQEDKNYKKALRYYYQGEIEYKNGEYKAALEMYQKSIEVDEKATYIPTILYHTGLSLEKTGDKAGAKKVLSSFVSNYPKHTLTPSVKKKLAELK